MTTSRTETCPICNGHGEYEVQVISGFYVEDIYIECEECGGTGEIGEQDQHISPE